MTKIESVSSCAVRVPLDTVTSFATRTVSERHYLLVKVRGDDEGTYILRHDLPSGRWQLTLYHSAEATEERPSGA